MDESLISLPVLSEVQHIARSTVVSGVRSPGGSLRTAVAVAYQRTRALITGAVPLPRVDSILKRSASTARPGSEEFETMLDGLGLPERTSGSVQYLVDGKAFFSDFVASIRRASTAIDSQVFIFDNDDVGVQVADELKARATAIPVRVLIDSLGSHIAHRVRPRTPMPEGFSAPAYMGRYLSKNSKIHFRATTNPAFMVDHTKLHIFDGTTAYLGGMNIGREYLSEWHDLMVKVEGPVVADLQAIFDRHWNGESWVRNWTLQNLFDRDRNGRVVSGGTGRRPGDVSLRVLQTDIGLGKVEIARALQLAIGGARERVWIESPYLAEDGVGEALIRAARHGIDVRVIIPEANESGIMQKNNFASAATLIRGGVKVYKYPGMTHLKGAICDGWAMYGSANCDTLSLRINREVNLAVSEPHAVAKFEQAVFEPDLRRSELLNLAEAERRGSILFEAVSDQL